MTESPTDLRSDALATDQDSFTTGEVWAIDGGKPLRGEITSAGAKNAVTKELVASMLTGEECHFTNVPRITEIDVTVSMLAQLGAVIERNGSELTIQTAELDGRISAEYSGINRIPILFLGPLLNRVGEAEIPFPGGCTIGPRPVDFHTAGLEAMGAEFEYSDNAIKARAPRRLRGTAHRLPFPSVGATENLLLAGVTAEGTTVIDNAAIEPEVIDLVLMLQKMGAVVSVETDRRIEVQGVKELKGTSHRVIEDRIEIASYAAAAVATGGDIDVIGARQEHLMTFLNVLRQVGGRFEVHDRGIRFSGKAGELQASHIETDVHPGFMTDWQQPTVVLLTQASGPSVIHETVYENRFGYTSLLRDMGADITLASVCLGSRTCRFASSGYKHSAVVNGATPLRPADLVIPDLRAGFAYVLAALLAEGQSTLSNVHYLQRGYEAIPDKLKNLGVWVGVRGGKKQDRQPQPV